MNISNWLLSFPPTIWYCIYPWCWPIFPRFLITLPTLLSACYFQFFSTFYLLHPIFNFCHPSRYIFAIISPCPGPKCGECIHWWQCSSVFNSTIGLSVEFSFIVIALSRTLDSRVFILCFHKINLFWPYLIQLFFLV